MSDVAQSDAVIDSIHSYLKKLQAVLRFEKDFPELQQSNMTLEDRIERYQMHLKCTIIIQRKYRKWSSTRCDRKQPRATNEFSALAAASRLGCDSGFLNFLKGGSHHGRKSNKRRRK